MDWATISNWVGAHKYVVALGATVVAGGGFYLLTHKSSASTATASDASTAYSPAQYTVPYGPSDESGNGGGSGSGTGTGTGGTAPGSDTPQIVLGYPSNPGTNSPTGGGPVTTPITTPTTQPITPLIVTPTSPTTTPINPLMPTPAQVAAVSTTIASGQAPTSGVSTALSAIQALGNPSGAPPNSTGLAVALGAAKTAGIVPPVVKKTSTATGAALKNNPSLYG